MFNSNTYHMHKHRKKAWSELAEARAIKSRQRLGTAYHWEIPRIAFFVKQARLSMRLYLSCRAIHQLETTNGERP